MVRCWKCGRENEEGMRFCTNCGAQMAAAPPGGETGYDPHNSETVSFNAPPKTSPGGGWTTTPYTAPQPAPPSAPSAKKGLVIAVVVALVLLGGLSLLGIAGWYYYQNTGGVATNNGNRRGGLDPDAKPTPGKANTNASPEASPTPASQQLFDPPTVPTKEGTFTVYANKGWQMSDIAVVPLERFNTSVDGIVDISGVKTGLRAGGLNDAKTKSRRLYPEYATGGLLMRTRYADGHFSNVVAAGVSGTWENLPDERGMLEFAINDNAPQDNGGQFTIKVKMTSVPKQQQKK